MKFALSDGIIDETSIRKVYEMKQRAKILANHPFKIYEGSDGKWYSYIMDEVHEKRKKIKRNSRKDIEDALVDYYIKLLNEPYFERAFNEWLQSKIGYGEITPATIDRYKRVYARYIKGSILNDKPIAYIDEHYLEHYIKSTIHDFSMSAKQYSNLRTVIRGTFNYAKKMDYCELSTTNFFGDIDLSRKMFRVTTKLDNNEVFTDSEVLLIRDYVFNNDNSLTSLGVLLAFNTGIRAGELSALKFSDFDLEHQVLKITKTEIRYYNSENTTVFEIQEQPKTENGFREVYLNDDALEIYRRIKFMNPNAEYIFDRAYENKDRIHAEAFTTRLRLICDKVHIKPRSIHKARKTYATKLINAGVNEKLIQEQMGHSDIATTRKYYYFRNYSDDTAKKEVLNAITFTNNE